MRLKKGEFNNCFDTICWYIDDIMLSLQHMEIGSKQTDQSMNHVITQVIQ